MPKNHELANEAHAARQIKPADTAGIDAFGRLRVSNPSTIFDSKQLYDNLPLLWDDQEESGGGTGSTFSAATASSTLDVTASTAGVRTRQTKRRFNYQPGKSQLIFMTGNLGSDGSGGDITTGTTARVGYFDDDNGLFFQNVAGALSVVRRTKVTGSVVDNVIAQDDWNLDRLDGTGKKNPSGIALSAINVNIFFIDFAWLGVSRVRMGVVVDGVIFYCHEFLNANNMTTVYMSTPNLPMRYQLINTASGGTGELISICSSMQSEGGNQNLGTHRYVSNDGLHVDATTADVYYALVGIRLKSTHLGATVTPELVSILAETDHDFEWRIILNPTVQGTFAYADVTNSAVQLALGATANTVTGGTILSGGYGNATFKGGAASAGEVRDPIALGALIDGTPDTMVLCAAPMGTGAVNADLSGGLAVHEIV